jgi:phosphotransferase system  glucose/maltose/N-acetylglucosamine-specific IIC component
LLLLLAAVPVVAAMLYGLSPWLASKMGSTVFLPQVVPMVVALLLLMVLLASWLPAQWRLRRPISQLLQAR